MSTLDLTSYERQAADFLRRHNLTLTVGQPADVCPPWAEPHNGGLCPTCGSTHGYRYRVRIRRRETGRNLTFYFWGSHHDMQEGRAPNAYDVLACISGDQFCPEDFRDFCAEYGYDCDSRKAYATWRRCLRFAKRLREFFTEQELAELAEIQ